MVFWKEKSSMQWVWSSRQSLIKIQTWFITSNFIETYETLAKLKLEVDNMVIRCYIFWGYETMNRKSYMTWYRKSIGITLHDTDSEKNGLLRKSVCWMKNVTLQRDTEFSNELPSFSFFRSNKKVRFSNIHDQLSRKEIPKSHWKPPLIPMEIRDSTKLGIWETMLTRISFIRRFITKYTKVFCISKNLWGHTHITFFSLFDLCR